MPGVRLARAAVVGALLATLLPVPASAHVTSTQLEQTRREIRATRARLASAVDSDAEIQATLRVVTSRLYQEQAALAAAHAHLVRIDLRIRSEQRRLGRLDDQQAQRRAIVGRRARALYILGPASGFDALSGRGTFDEYVGRAGMLEYVMRFDRTIIEDLARLEDEARKTRAALRDQRVEAVDVRDEIAHRVSLVSEIVAAKQEAHSAWSNRINGYRGELAALAREQARIKAIINSRSSISTGPISRSGFAWPIRGQITSPYGPRWGGFHTGIDIDCRTGDPIGASKAGRVISSGWGGGYGYMVIIDHGNGVTTLYAHMSRLYVGEGTSVSQLRAVGACGATGNATGDHLHFEVRVNGQHQNPMNFLP